MEYLHKGQFITSQTDNKTNIYAPCWFVEQNNRYRVWFHTEHYMGIYRHMCFCPRSNLGLMWLSNCEPPSDPRYAIMRHVIDYYMDLPPQDYSGQALENTLPPPGKGNEETTRKSESCCRTSPYNEYTGVYDHPSLGEAVVTWKTENCTLPWARKTFSLPETSDDTLMGKYSDFVQADRLLL